MFLHFAALQKVYMVSVSANGCEVEDSVALILVLRGALTTYVTSVPCFKVTILVLDVGEHMFLSEVSYLTSHGGFECSLMLRESIDKEIVEAHPCYKILHSKELISEL